MSTVVTAIILLISYVMETTLLSSINFFGASPKLVLIAIICYSMVCGKEKGLVLAIFTGFIVDVLSSSSAFGINILLYSYSAAIAGALSDRIFGKNAITAVVITFIVSFIYGIIFSFVMYILKFDQNIVYLIFAYFLPMCVYNAIISFFVYLLVENLYTLSYRRS